MVFQNSHQRLLESQIENKVHEIIRNEQPHNFSLGNQQQVNSRSHSGGSDDKTISMAGDPRVTYSVLQDLYEKNRIELDKLMADLKISKKEKSEL